MNMWFWFFIVFQTAVTSYGFWRLHKLKGFINSSLTYERLAEVRAHHIRKMETTAHLRNCTIARLERRVAELQSDLKYANDVNTDVHGRFAELSKRYAALGEVVVSLKDKDRRTQDLAKRDQQMNAMVVADALWENRDA